MKKFSYWDTQPDIFAYDVILTLCALFEFTYNLVRCNVKLNWLCFYFPKVLEGLWLCGAVAYQHAECCDARHSDAGKWSLGDFIVINQLQIWPRGDMDSIRGVYDANLCRWLSLVYCMSAWNSRVRKWQLLHREQAVEITDLCQNCHPKKNIIAQKRLASQSFW